MNDAETLKSLTANSKNVTVDEQNKNTLKILYNRLLLDMKWSAEIGRSSYRVFKDSALQYGLDDDTESTKLKVIQMLKDNGFIVTEGKTGWGIFGLSYIEISWGDL
jgi:hypothetical protein